MLGALAVAAAACTSGVASNDAPTTAGDPATTPPAGTLAASSPPSTAPVDTTGDPATSPASTAASSAAGVAPASTAAPVAPVGGFLETFDGAPSSPQAFTGWESIVHTRDGQRGEVFPMSAGHGADCAGPPAEHEIVEIAASVFSCKDHVMTAIDGGEYGMISMTAPMLVDFSAGTAVVEWDVSTLLASGRDWWDVWVTPAEDVERLPGDPDLPDDAVRPPANAIQIRLTPWEAADDSSPARTGVMVYLRRDAGDDEQGEVLNTEDYEGIEVAVGSAGMSPSRRDTFRLELSADRIKFGMPDYDHWFVDEGTAIAPALDWTQGVVQIAHHSYNPQKDDYVSGAKPGTWHWDNVLIAPAIKPVS